MPTSFRIDTQLGVIFTTCRERVTDSEVVNYMCMVAQDSAYSPLFKHLIDCTHVTSFEVSADLTRSVAGRKLFSSRSQCAIVAPQDHIFGMARMFELQHRGSVQVFRKIIGARKWLGIDQSAYSPSLQPPGLAAQAS